MVRAKQGSCAESILELQPKLGVKTVGFGADQSVGFDSILLVAGETV